MRGDRGQDRRAARGAVVGALLVLAALAGAAQASAATYHAFLCRIPYGPNAGKPAPTDNTTYTQTGSYTSSSQNCADGGSMQARMDGGAARNYGDSATVTFAPPAGLTVAGFTVWRHQAVTEVQPFGAPVTNLYYTGTQSVEGLCARSVGCAARGNASVPLAAENAVAVANLSGVTEVKWDAACGGGPGGTCPPSGQGTYSAVNSVFAADMLLSDTVPPAVGATGGPLLGGGTLAGAQSASIAASDSGSGVQKAVFVVDGAIAAEQSLDTSGSAACTNLGVAPDGRPSYVNTQPCPPSVSGLATLNTDALTPGAHSLTILVADAAGNTTVAHTGTIAVVGSLPAGTPNGAGASRTARLTARFGTRGKRARRLGYRTRPTITGRLVNERRVPITGAVLTILARDRRSGARIRPVASATTGADGRFRVTLPSGPSRTITLRYKAFTGDTRSAATAQLRALVGARVSAFAAQRSVRVGAPLRLSGRLQHLRRAGVAISIQVRESTGWRTFDTVKTRKDGRYRWTHRFRSRALAGRAVPFRARVDSPIYPFEPGTSPVVGVRFR